MFLIATMLRTRAPFLPLLVLLGACAPGTDRPADRFDVPAAAAVGVEDAAFGTEVIGASGALSTLDEATRPSGQLDAVVASDRPAAPTSPAVRTEREPGQENGASPSAEAGEDIVAGDTIETEATGTPREQVVGEESVELADGVEPEAREEGVAKEKAAAGEKLAAEERAVQEEREQAERETQERAAREERERAEREERERAEREEREQAEREERERAAREEREQAELEERERAARDEEAARKEQATRAEDAESESATSRFGQAAPLRELAARHGLRIGNAAPNGMRTLDDAATFQAIMAEEFDILTPENAMKMTEIQPERGRFDWEESDRIVEFAERHDMLVHGHPLLWKEQIPRWARDLDKPERAEAMREHIRALVSRYRGRIAVWDVVNEALLDDGQWRQTLWQRAVGNDYLRESFVLARELDPQAALIYNDYAIGGGGTKADAVYDLIVAELSRGTPIDGVGFQMHMSTAVAGSPVLDGIRSNFERFAELGLDLYITEMDIGVDWRRDAAEEAELQAEVYAEVLRICLEQPRCRALQIWGLSDEHSWRGALEATPLGENFSAKPAFHAMQRVLEETPVARERLERAPNPGAEVAVP